MGFHQPWLRLLPLRLLQQLPFALPGACTLLPVSALAEARRLPEPLLRRERQCVRGRPLLRWERQCVQQERQCVQRERQHEGQEWG